MKPWVWALLGGAVGAGAVFAVVLPSKIRALEERGRQVQQQLERGGGGSGTLAQSAQAMRARLEAYANTYATQAAQRAGDEHLRTAYGITQDRMARVQALAQRWGIR